MEILTGGRIWVGGELIGIEERNGKLHMRTDKDIARQRSRIGMVFQRFNLFPHMTAVENVMEAPVQVKGLKKAAVRTKALAPAGQGRAGRSRRLLSLASSPAGSSSGWPSPGPWPWSPS